MQNKRILVVAAHPDDEVLGCGGTISKYAGGNVIKLLLLGVGLNARLNGGQRYDARTIDAHLAKSLRVAALLGIQEVWHRDFPDNRFDTVPRLDLIKSLEATLAAFAPEVIFTHAGADLNIDHRITLEAVLTATRPRAGCPVREVYSFAVPSATEWAFGRIHGTFTPNLFIDISDRVELKQQALLLYDTETLPYPHPRSPEAVRAEAQRWGTVAGVAGAEAFEIIRIVR